MVVLSDKPDIDRDNDLSAPCITACQHLSACPSIGAAMRAEQACKEESHFFIFLFGPWNTSVQPALTWHH